MPVWRPLLRAIGLPLGLAAIAQGAPAPALAVFDAYLAQAARNDPTYRADLRLAGDPPGAGVGRFTAQSAFLGPFTYRPKLYAELTAAERVLLLRDPQFQAFLLRAAPPRQAPAPPAAASVAYHCSISPEDMLRAEPLRIVLSPP
jgi:hypothetical protein